MFNPLPHSYEIFVLELEPASLVLFYNTLNVAGVGKRPSLHLLEYCKNGTKRLSLNFSFSDWVHSIARYSQSTCSYGLRRATGTAPNSHFITSCIAKSNRQNIFVIFVVVIQRHFNERHACNIVLEFMQELIMQRC